MQEIGKFCNIKVEARIYFDFGRGDSSSIEKTSPFYVCRRIFQQLLFNPLYAELAAYCNKFV